MFLRREQCLDANYEYKYCVMCISGCIFQNASEVSNFRFIITLTSRACKIPEKFCCSMGNQVWNSCGPPIHRVGINHIFRQKPIKIWWSGRQEILLSVPKQFHVTYIGNQSSGVVTIDPFFIHSPAHKLKSCILTISWIYHGIANAPQMMTIIQTP